MQFRRRDMNDGAEELLAIVRLDGEELPDGNREWAEAVPVPADVVEAVEDGWANGNYVVERMMP